MKIVCRKRYIAVEGKEIVEKEAFRTVLEGESEYMLESDWKPFGEEAERRRRVFFECYRFDEAENIGKLIYSNCYFEDDEEKHLIITDEGKYKLKRILKYEI